MARANASRATLELRANTAALQETKLHLPATTTACAQTLHSASASRTHPLGFGVARPAIVVQHNTLEQLVMCTATLLVAKYTKTNVFALQVTLALAVILFVLRQSMVQCVRTTACVWPRMAQLSANALSNTTGLLAKHGARLITVLQSFTCIELNAM